MAVGAAAGELQALPFVESNTLIVYAGGKGLMMGSCAACSALMKEEEREGCLD